MRTAREDRGIATIAVAAACLFMTALVLDGGTVLRARSSSFDLAGGAARAAAQQLDQPALAQGQIVLDAQAARRTALDWLAARGASGTVAVASDTVTVTVRRDVRLQLLRRTVTVDEAATAQAQRGRSAA